MATKPDESKTPTMENKNVLKGPLHMFSQKPPTGFFRDGYCRTSPEDKGHHVVAGLVNDEFLNFSASKGNNLRDVGVKSGMKWCLCSARWKEAFDAAQKGDIPKDAVPKVFLHATEQSALDLISYKDLVKYSADGEAPNQKNRQDSHINPGTTAGSAVKEV